MTFYSTDAFNPGCLFSIPIGSMGLVYLSTFTIKINHSCRQIYQTRPMDPSWDTLKHPHVKCGESRVPNLDISSSIIHICTACVTAVTVTKSELRKNTGIHEGLSWNPLRKMTEMCNMRYRLYTYTYIM